MRSRCCLLSVFWKVGAALIRIVLGVEGLESKPSVPVTSVAVEPKHTCSSRLQPSACWMRESHEELHWLDETSGDHGRAPSDVIICSEGRWRLTSWSSRHFSSRMAMCKLHCTFEKP